MLDLGYTPFVGITDVMLCSSRYILSGATWLICPLTVDIPMDHLSKVLYACFPPGEVSGFSFVINSIWWEDTLKLCNCC